MASVSFECHECGRYENPMIHASNGCNGSFVWTKSGRVLCEGCGRTYPTSIPFWCGRCGKRHSNFSLG